MKSRLKRWLVTVCAVLSFFTVWELSSYIYGKQALFPSALLVAQTIISEIKLGLPQELLISSLTHYSIGIIGGGLLGVVCGTVVALSPTCLVIFEAVGRIIRPIPPIAWIPFSIIWFGVSHIAAAFIIAIGVFWIMYFSSSSAIAAAEASYIELACAFGHNGTLHILRKVTFPAALPGIINGMRTALAQGWVYVVAAELSGVSGMGSRMWEAAGLIATDQVLSYMLLIAAAYSLTDLAFERVELGVTKWRER